MERTLSLFIAFENDKWCKFIVRIASPTLISDSFYFFLFYIIFCVDSTTFWF